MKNRNNGNGPRRGNNVPPRMQVFDSNGPDVRIRGTAWQVHEKYQALAKDAASAGDVIMAENYMQHAEHYQRIINSFAESMGSAWVPNAADNDDMMEADGNMAAPVQQPQQVAAQRAEGARNENPRREASRDDLGLPSSLFKPTTQVATTTNGMLESA